MRAERYKRAVVGAVVLALSQLVLTSCSEKQMSDGTLTQACRPSTGATGKEVVQSHPTKPSECKYVLVLHCNACVYDAQGALSHSVSKPCGVCFTASTP